MAGWTGGTTFTVMVILISLGAAGYAFTVMSYSGFMRIAVSAGIFLLSTIVLVMVAGLISGVVGRDIRH